MDTQVSGVNRWLTLNGKSLSFDRGSENMAAGAKEYDFNRIRLTAYAPDGVEIRIDDEPLETEIYGRWTWRPGGFAGLYDLTVSAPGHGRFQTKIRVLPSHLSHERHVWMLQDIAKFSADLLYQLQSPASERLTSESFENLDQSPLRSYLLIKNLIEELALAVEHINQMPYRSLHNRSQRQQWHQIMAYDSYTIPTPGPVLSIPGSFQRMPDVWPQEWQIERSSLTYDVYENRLLKHFLWRQFLPRLTQIEDSANQEIERRRKSLAIIKQKKWNDTESERIAELEQAVAACRVMQRRAIGWGSLPFLREVRPETQRTIPTQVLQKHPAYSRFYRVYLSFQKELRQGLENDKFLTAIATRKMSELYETWSVLRMTTFILHILIKSGYSLISENRFYRIEDQFFHFEVDRNASIELAKDATRVVLRYEPVYPPMHQVVSGLVTARSYQRTPDLSVEVWESGVPSAVLIFDAKYKTVEKRGRQTFIVEDLEKMSIYYSEIAWKTRNSRGRPKPVVSSAYILYPGEVIEHDADYPSVGALPFVPEPKQTRDVYQVIIDLVKTAGLV